MGKKELKKILAFICLSSTILASTNTNEFHELDIERGYDLFAPRDYLQARIKDLGDILKNCYKNIGKLSEMVEEIIKERDTFMRKADERVDEKGNPSQIDMDTINRMDKDLDTLTELIKTTQIRIEYCTKALRKVTAELAANTSITNKQ